MSDPDFYNPETVPPAPEREPNKTLAKRMSVADLRLTQEFQQLTEKQQLFVASYCDGGLVKGIYDPVVAALTAYKCKSLEVARIMSYSLMQNIRIIAALNRHFRTEPIEAFLTMLDRAINNKHVTVAQVQALKLKCDVMGYGNRLSNQAPMVAGLREAKEAAKFARKSLRKNYTKNLKPEKPSEFGFDK